MLNAVSDDIGQTMVISTVHQAYRMLEHRQLITARLNQDISSVSRQATGTAGDVQARAATGGNFAIGSGITLTRSVRCHSPRSRCP
ncbi:hypothetical protein [Sodalis-like endosymbiont of Proechinophthirus fluctus]|uniref:hypothetical protein n=1 Tax=Sodalis-like endosymbiont of Proechinophthirus fluctus TaxID=1462730 RepID=UPI00164F55ED|nr:hypothetical protein [Sodalis-like endosymbiont of Proechinophthirus fluctus]